MRSRIPETIKSLRAGLAAGVLRNAHGEWRNGWWIGLYLLMVAVMLLPLSVWLQTRGEPVALWQQAGIGLLAAWLLQRLRRKPLAEMFGAVGKRWWRECFQGLALGGALMLAPALCLWLGGWVQFRVNPLDGPALLLGFWTCLLVAVTEETIFRGVFLQRLQAGLGALWAQLLVGAYFWLTHAANPGMDGSLRYLASVNIFVASLMFGLAYFRTRSLAMPLGLHLMANFVQGSVLGFGVSGHAEAGWLRPDMGDSPPWLTGASFGLEASVPGLLAVLACALFLLRWRPAPATTPPMVRDASPGRS